jgi:acyl carrier protein
MLPECTIRSADVLLISLEVQVSIAQKADAPYPGWISDRNIITRKVRTYIIDNFLLGSDDDFDDDTQLMEIGILDSTGAMELVSFLEETFTIKIDDDEIRLENLNSVSYICNFILLKSHQG